MRKRGFTLVELLITIALLGLVVTVITNMMIFGMRAHEGTVEEFDVQSQVRLVSDKVNTIIRDASGVYLLHKENPTLSDFTEGWNYLMVNDTKDAIVEWVWSPSEAKHKPVALSSKVGDATYELIFSKETRPDEDRLLDFTLNVSVGERTIELGSTLESVNSLQVVDRSLGNVANTLAYRRDSRITNVGVAQAAVSLVLDTSGSMTYTDVGGRSRIDVMKEETTKLINGLAENDNIYVSVSPFNFSANATSSSLYHKMLPLKSNLSSFVNNIIPSLSAGGATNTGDGMRRGYHAIKNFNELPANADITTKNFMIILVDGDSNQSSLNYLYESVLSPNNPYPHHFNDNGKMFEYLERDWYWYDNRVGYKYGFRYVSDDGATRTVWENPVNHTFTVNGIEYQYIRWFTSWWNSYFRYETTASQNERIKFVSLDGDVKEPYYNRGWIYGDNNTYYENGAVFDKLASEYVSFMGNQITTYKNTRNDDISVYVIGFKTSGTSGLKHIADSTKAIGPSETQNFYTADTSEALKAVLDEIKFQINDKLWHIGGPN